MLQQEAPVVITGASGRTGNAIVKRLLEKGHAVKAVCRDISKLTSLQQMGAELFDADFTDAARLTKAFMNAKQVYILTPLNLKAENVNEEQRQNINGIIQAIKEAGVQNIVVLSSWGTELTEKSGGILGNRLLEQELEKISDLNAVIR